MKEPVVSVLIAAYNREKYIGMAIKSILASSYTDFELIVVDDNSKDRTLEIVQSYAVKDARVKVYVNETNLGDYPNRNQAAKYATGKYLKYVDDDDYIYPWGLQLMVGMMEQFPEAGWGLCSLIQYFKMPFPFMLNPKETYQYNYFGPGLFHKAPLSSIIKREIFEAVGGFTTTRVTGDFEMWNKLAQKHNVVLMPDGMVWYREHREKESSSHREFMLDYEDIRLKYLKSPDCPMLPGEIKRVIKNKKNHHLKSLFFNAITLKYSKAADSFRLWRYYIGK